MSDDHEHESFIKTPKQLIITVIVSFAVPILVAVLASQFVTFGRKMPSPEAAERLAHLIQPVASVQLATDQPAAGAAKSGEQVYQSVCAGCHGSGAAGSPKVGDAAAWGPRIAQGMDTLLRNALGGKGAMPAKGGNPALSDDEIKSAVEYMTEKSK